MTEAQIKYMVERFLGWKLPRDTFNPDCGISFDKSPFNAHTAHPMLYEPTGTNLFDSEQATAMVRYMVNGLTSAAAESEFAWLIEAPGPRYLMARKLVVAGMHEFVWTADHNEAEAMTQHIDIVFDGPPGPECGRFIEVEDDAGKSIKFGKWLQRADGYWVLRIPAPPES